jgi:hypothetical protein
MIRDYTREQRKQLHTIMNVDDSLQDEDAILLKCLEFVARMCDPHVLNSSATFYIDTSVVDGSILLETD